MNLPLFSLKIVWDFIGPVIQDLLNEGGKRILSSSKTRSIRQNFYQLYSDLGDFDNALREFVAQLASFLEIAEQRASKSRRLSTMDRMKLDKAGVLLSKSLKRLDASLKKVNPELDIYAHEIGALLGTTYYSEWETLSEIQKELKELSNAPIKYMPMYYGPGDFAIQEPLIESIDISQLERQLRSAQINLELSTRSIEELRGFIKNNIPLNTE